MPPARQPFNRSDLIAERTTQTVRLDPNAFQDSGVDVPAAPFLGGVYHHEQGLLQMVDVNQIIASAGGRTVVQSQRRAVRNRRVGSGLNAYKRRQRFEVAQGCHWNTSNKFCGSASVFTPKASGRSAISSAVGRRMASREIGSVKEYVHCLHRCGDELTQLIETVVIPETWFFRDNKPFQLLKNFALGLQQRHGRRCRCARSAFPVPPAKNLIPSR